MLLRGVKYYTGQTLLVSSKNWTGEVIQDFQEEFIDKEAGKYNHAAKILVQKSGVYVVESAERGAGIQPIEYYLDGDYGLVLCTPKFQYTEEEYERILLPMCGHVRYSYFDLIVAFPIYLVTFKKLWVGSKFENGKSLTCSQLCAYADNKVNGLVFPFPQKISPADIYLSVHFQKHKIK